jgi:ParB-like chromosome segregation protein Spo0J
MTPEEFAGLVDSIRSLGLIQPIARLDGLILDGRERLRACLYAGVEPRFKDLTDCDSPVSYIMSENYYRQHLTPAEIATAKAKLFSLGLDSVT